MTNPFVAPVVLAAVLTVAGCNTPSMEEFQRLETEVAELRVRLEDTEARASASAMSVDSALDSAGQCNQVCQQVSERLDELYLETTPR
jgi:outer membrane murein-binding lipoprotein Lpp